MVDIKNDIVEVYSHFYRKDRKFTETEYEDILAQNCSREELKPLRYYNDLDYLILELSTLDSYKKRLKE